VWEGGRDPAATARGPDESGDDLGGGRLQRRWLGEDGFGSGGSDSGSGHIWQWLVGGRFQRWRLSEDEFCGHDSGEEQPEGAPRRRRRWLGPVGGDWAPGVAGYRKQCGGCVLYVVD
jgi:hypothetical protein